jgi:hypothetical protein
MSNIRGINLPPYHTFNQSRQTTVSLQRGHTHPDAHTHSHRHTHIQSPWRTHTLTLKHTDTHTQSHTHILTLTHTHSHTDTHTQSHRHTHTHTDAHTHSHTHTGKCYEPFWQCRTPFVPLHYHLPTRFTTRYQYAKYWMLKLDWAHSRVSSSLECWFGTDTSNKWWVFWPTS